MQIHKYILGFAFALLLAAKSASCQTIKLHVPVLEESPQQHLFYHELLTTALLDAGHTPELITKKYPQKRIKQLLNRGELSIYWMIKSNARDKQYTPININLTNHLIAKRVLLIKHGTQPVYDKVKTLEDFRALQLVAGMGKNWFDRDVWDNNNLLYKEKEGNWKSIFKMVARSRDYDYFPRGVNEVLVEASLYPELDIEKNLVFIYDRDFQFYLSNAGRNPGKPYLAILTDALLKAQESGLLVKLLQKYWQTSIDAINEQQRIKIHLAISG